MNSLPSLVTIGTHISLCKSTTFHVELAEPRDHKRTQRRRLKRTKNSGKTENLGRRIFSLHDGSHDADFALLDLADLPRCLLLLRSAAHILVGELHLPTLEPEESLGASVFARQGEKRKTEEEEEEEQDEEKEDIND